MNTIHTLSSTVLILAASAAVHAAFTLYVGTTGVPGGDYYTEIQAAVDAAYPGQLIVVSNGVYNTGGAPKPGYSLSNRVMISDAVTIRSVSGPDATIILGAPASGGGCGDDAVRCVYMTNGAELIGFTLSNGFTMTTAASWVFELTGGGAMLDHGGLVSNCTVAGNRAYSQGGGVFAYSGGTILDCEIAGNNVSDQVGGGVRLHYGGTMSNCTIIGNSAPSAGGVLCEGNAIVTHCIISGNSADQVGGGANCGRSTLSYSTISGNVAHNLGGGVHCSGDGAAVKNCTICDNVLSSSNGLGGGIHVDSYGVLGEAFVAIENCDIHGNTAPGWGGGVYAEAHGGKEGYGYVVIRNCTISENTASNLGGGAYCETSSDGSISNQNTIVYFNNCVDSPDSSNCYNVGDVTYAYCCTTPQPSGPGNIANDPLFANKGDDDYHLTVSSPCRDAGTNAYAALPWDRDGEPRIYDDTVDMGCYEFIPEPLGVVGYWVLAVGWWCRVRFQVSGFGK